MRKLKFILFFALFVSMGQSATSQDQGIDTIKKVPQVCISPRVDFQSGQIISNWGTGNRPWNVFSNTDNNVAYKDISCKNRAGVKFPFLKTFYVLDEYDDAVKVVVDSYVNVGFLNLLPGYRDSVYYLPKNKVLLWNNPLVSDSLLIDECTVKLPQKAMIIKDLNNIKSQHIHINPAYIDSGMYISDYQQRNVEVLYLYQYDETNNAYLCGIDSKIPSSKFVASSIIGWVHAKSLSKWHSNLSLEPNWTNVPKRKEAEQFIKVYKRHSDARSYANNKKHNPANQLDLIFDEQDYINEILNNPFNRLPGDMLRFQLITKAIDLTNEYPRVGVVGDKRDEDCNCNFDPATVAEYGRKVSAVMEKRQTNNIIFVIDGTQSMDHALEGVVKALTETMKNIEKENKDQEDAGGEPINYNFGAVVYRDTDDENPWEITANGDLTDNRARVISDLRRIFSHGANTSTVPEAVFLGIKKAVEQFKPDPDNRNYLILIGDAGNNFSHTETDFSTAIVSGWLCDRNIDFFSIQIRHKSDNAYDEYCKESKEILTQNVLCRNDKFKAKYECELSNANSCVRCNFETHLGEVYNAITASASNINMVSNSGTVTGVDFIDNNLVSVPYNIFNGAMAMGAMVCIPESNDPDDIIHENELSNLLTYFLKNINNTSRSFGRSNSSADDYMKRIIADLFRSDSLTMEVLAAVLGDGIQLYQEGFTAYNPQWLSDNAGVPIFDDNLWQYVSFLSHTSVSDLITDLNILFPPNFGSVYQLRENIYTVLKYITVYRLRYLTEEEFNDARICDVLSLLTGLPTDRTFFDWCSVVMLDILNPNKVPDKAILDMSLNFIIFNGHLQSIQKEKVMIDMLFFEMYLEYIYKYFKEINIVVDPINERDLLDALADYYMNYSFYYENPSYLFTDIRNRKNMNNKYYWIPSSFYPAIRHTVDIIEAANSITQNH